MPPVGLPVVWLPSTTLPLDVAAHGNLRQVERAVGGDAAAPHRKAETGAAGHRTIVANRAKGDGYEGVCRAVDSCPAVAGIYLVIGDRHVIGREPGARVDLHAAAVLGRGWRAAPLDCHRREGEEGEL